MEVIEKKGNKDFGKTVIGDEGGEQCRTGADSVNRGMTQKADAMALYINSPSAASYSLS
jgi:hypothetical protein